MQVVVDRTTITPLQDAPVIPVAPLPAAAIPSSGNADSKPSSGGQNRQQQSGSNSGARFRSVLDAATVAGLGLRFASASGRSSAAANAAATQRQQRTPSSDSQELNGADAAELYRAVRAYKASAGGKQVEAQSDAAEESDGTSEPVSPQHALAATSRYAQSFFSVGGTFAARGETLELSA